jgi:hypothetical protein
LLAREATGQTRSYRADGSRRALLLADPAFAAEYQRAKDRIRRMSVRYVDEPDPVTPTLLVVHVAPATEARYNDFDTH